MLEHDSGLHQTWNRLNQILKCLDQIQKTLNKLSQIKWNVWSLNNATFRQPYMWCPREGTSSRLKCIWFYLEMLQIQDTWPPGFLLLKVEIAWVKLTAWNFSTTLTNKFIKCNVIRFGVNEYIT